MLLCWTYDTMFSLNIHYLTMLIRPIRAYCDLDHVGDEGARNAGHQTQDEIVHLPAARSPNDVPHNEKTGRATR